MTFDPRQSFNYLPHYQSGVQYGYGYLSPYGVQHGPPSPQRRRADDHHMQPVPERSVLRDVSNSTVDESLQQQICDLANAEVHLPPARQDDGLEQHTEQAAQPGPRANRPAESVATAAALIRKRPGRPKQEKGEGRDPRRKYRGLVNRDGTGEKKNYGMHIPNVVNYRQAWSNKQLEYHPFPEDLDDIRQKLYDFKHAMLFNSQQFVDYWPHITNLFSRVGPSKHMENSTQWETWRCKNGARAKARERLRVPDAERKRKRTMLPLGLEDEQHCPARFKVVMYIKHADTDEDHKLGLGSCSCVPDWVHVEPTGRARHESVKHNHTMEALDRFQRSDALKLFAKQKVEEGPYTPDAVKDWMHEKFSSATKQIEYLAGHDIASVTWGTIRDRAHEMKHEVDDDNQEFVQKQDCLEAISTSTVKGLKMALTQLCYSFPEAVQTVLPTLKQFQLPTSEKPTTPERVLIDDNIPIPQPGFPDKLWSQYAQPLNPPTKHPSSQVSQVGQPGPTVPNTTPTTQRGPPHYTPPAGFQPPRVGFDTLQPATRLPLPPLGSVATNAVAANPYDRSLLPYHNMGQPQGQHHVPIAQPHAQPRPLVLVDTRPVWAGGSATTPAAFQQGKQPAETATPAGQSVAVPQPEEATGEADVQTLLAKELEIG